VQGYWPVGRLRKRELGTECLVLKIFENPRPSQALSTRMKLTRRGSGNVLEWTPLAAWRVPTLLHSTQRRCPALFHRVVSSRQPVQLMRNKFT
jgi:hypothetical protein